MMGTALPVVAIVGRPNVGKSTLFNALTRKRDALVFNEPGVTRDRIYGRWETPAGPVLLIDTGGMVESAPSALESLMRQQSQLAMAEADLIVWVVDAQSGMHPDDQALAPICRSYGKPVVVVVNKVDGLDPDLAATDFYGWGFSPVIRTAATHRRGLEQLAEAIMAHIRVDGANPIEAEDETDAEPAAERQEAVSAARPIQLAIVGRPNVGKSTLVNRVLGEERQLVFDGPGTTRDSVWIPFSHPIRGQQVPFVLIDTAGIRRKGRIAEGLEKFSVVKSLQAIESSDVALFLFNAQEGITEQDRHILGYIIESGTALVMAVNKWDGLSEAVKTDLHAEIQRTLGFVSFAKIHFISALHGTHIETVFRSVYSAYHSSRKTIDTPTVNQALEAAQKAYLPPMVRGRRIKLRYAHMGGHHPPTVVVHGNGLDNLPTHYVRFLENFFRKAFRIEGTPLRIQLKTGENPFAGRRNTLTPRQLRKKKRLMRHVKGSKT